jgi:hypothetical protein
LNSQIQIQTNNKVAVPYQNPVCYNLFFIWSFFSNLAFFALYTYFYLFLIYFSRSISWSYDIFFECFFDS